MTLKERDVLVAELNAALTVHDRAAIDLMKGASRHLRRAREIERELQRLEKPRRRTADARVAFA